MMRNGQQPFGGAYSDEEDPAPVMMWRTQDWRLILFREGTASNPGVLRGELYNLKDAPNQWRNLYDHPDFRSIQAELMHCLNFRNSELNPGCLTAEATAALQANL